MASEMKNNDLCGELVWPFGDLDVSEEYLRETMYEILIMCCRTSPSCSQNPLTYSANVQTSPQAEKSPTKSPAGKIWRALGLRSNKTKAMNSSNGNGVIVSPSYSPSYKSRKAPCVSEVVRLQFGVSEQTDTRLRRALLRIFSGQHGKRAENVVLPLELLQQLKPSDFSHMNEYHAWQKRQLRILEVGLLLHPYLPLKIPNISAHKLKEIIWRANEKPIETGNNSETMQALSDAVMSLAWTSNKGTSLNICHWVDAFPLNLHLYLILLGSCFDRSEQTTLIEEIDEVVDLAKKTWVVLRINQMLHNICFTWILFQQFVTTGQTEIDFLGAVESQLAEISKDAKEAKDTLYMKVLNSFLGSMLSWAEKKLLVYHDRFHTSEVGFMQSVLQLALATVKILAKDVSNIHIESKEELDVSRSRVDIYIRSSVRNAFAKKMQKVDASNTLFKGQEAVNSDLLILAKDTCEVVRKEKETYSPILKIWHPFATGVAAATLHSCYGRELKRFLLDVTTITPKAIQVLQSAESLEKELVQIIVEHSADSEDGGKGVIQEMSPYEADSSMLKLTRTWIKERLDRLEECINRTIQQEVWSPKTDEEQYASSAVEVLAIAKDSLDEFFYLRVPNHSDALLDLVTGLERSLQRYISNAISGCGSKNSYLPSLPPLTRCKKESKFFGLWKRKRTSPVLRKSRSLGRSSKCLKTPSFRRSRSLGGSINCLQSTTGSTFGLAQLYVRLNTLCHIQSEFFLLDQVISDGLKKVSLNETRLLDSVPKDKFKMAEDNFKLARADTQEGIQKLYESSVYKIVFHDLKSDLWEGLYSGGVPNARINSVLRKLELNMDIIKKSVNHSMQVHIIAALMKTSLEGFILVLLAGGPSRVYLKHDSQMIEEDFKSLKDLFKTHGNLSADIVENAGMSVSEVLHLFSLNTEDIIENYRSALSGANGRSLTKSKLPLPPTSGFWSLADPNTILRVLCCRNDYLASHFLKKVYRLPKRI